MSLSLLLIIVAFLLGAITSITLSQTQKHEGALRRWRRRAYQFTTGYLLCKIGFSGGSEIAQESFSDILFPVVVCLSLAFLWTFFLLLVLRNWSPFDEMTRTSIAAHFGSVSVGTFIAALAFLEGAGIPFDQGAALWLALMELPAILVAIWKLPVSAKKVLRFLAKDWYLGILFLSLVLGSLFGTSIPEALETFFLSTLFLPLLLYFLFEVGEKAGASIFSIRRELRSFLLIGIGIPILGGMFGVSVGQLLGYSLGNAILLSVLIASASYVLAPLCLHEMLKMVPHVSLKKAQSAIGISMFLSVGITLPFNILVGLELYRFFAESTIRFPILAFIGVSLPALLVLVGTLQKYFFPSHKSTIR